MSRYNNQSFASRPEEVVGRVATSRAGRDAGTVYLIVGTAGRQAARRGESQAQEPQAPPTRASRAGRGGSARLGAGAEGRGGPGGLAGDGGRGRVADGQEGRHRGGGDRGGGATQRHVPCGAGVGPQGPRPHLGQDADPFHPDPPGGSGQGRAVPLRPHAGTHHLPLPVGGRGGGGSREGARVGPADVREVQGGPPREPRHGDLRQPEAQAEARLGAGRAVWLASQGSIFPGTSGWRWPSPTSTGSGAAGHGRSSRSPGSTPTPGSGT